MMEQEWTTPDGRWRVYAEVVNGVVILSFEDTGEDFNEINEDDR